MMNSPTTLISKYHFEPILKAGQRVRIEPLNKYGFFEIPRTATPENLPSVEVNLATPFSSALAAASDTGQESPIKLKKTDLDMNPLNLAHYRLIAYDPGVKFRISQPAATGKYTNKAGTMSFHWGSTMQHLVNQNWSQLPEIFVFEDQTSPTIEAVNMDLDESTYYARIMAFGFRYPLNVLDVVLDRNTGFYYERQHVDSTGRIKTNPLTNRPFEPILAALTVTVESKL